MNIESDSSGFIQTSKTNICFGLGCILRGAYRQLIPKIKSRATDIKETPKPELPQENKKDTSDTSIGMGKKKRVYKGGKTKKRHKIRRKQDIKNDYTNF